MSEMASKNVAKWFSDKKYVGVYLDTGLGSSVIVVYTYHFGGFQSGLCVYMYVCVCLSVRCGCYLGEWSRCQRLVSSRGRSSTQNLWDNCQFKSRVQA